LNKSRFVTKPVTKRKAGENRLYSHPGGAGKQRRGKAATSWTGFRDYPTITTGPFPVFLTGNPAKRAFPMISTAILQSNYLPWKGVFDMINRVDNFVFYEGVQYTKRDWRNRNRIMTRQGPRWITVPVRTRGRFEQRLSDVEIETRYNWQKKHHKSFQYNYAKAPFFEKYKWIIENIYLENEWENLSRLNIYTTKLLSDILGIKTNFIELSRLPSIDEKNERIITVCQRLKSSRYVSGPSASKYLDPEKFRENDIKIEYMRYEYPEYKQLH